MFHVLTDIGVKPIQQDLKPPVIRSYFPKSVDVPSENICHRPGSAAFHIMETLLGLHLHSYVPASLPRLRNVNLTALQYSCTAIQYWTGLAKEDAINGHLLSSTCILTFLIKCNVTGKR